MQLLRTLKALESYYDDAYVLDNGQKITMSQVVAKKVVEEKAQPVKVKSEKPKEVKKAKVKSDNGVGVKTHTKIIAPTKNVEEAKDYTLEIILALLVLIAIGYIIIKTSKRKKRDEEE